MDKWIREEDWSKLAKGAKLGNKYQGSIYVFIFLIFTYVFLMGRLDKKVSDERDKKDS